MKIFSAHNAKSMLFIYVTLKHFAMQFYMLSMPSALPSVIENTFSVYFKTFIDKQIHILCIRLTKSCI